MDVSSLENELEKAVGTGAKYSKRRVGMEGPDGGLAWIVALAACVINFIMSGLARMSGILFVAFINSYGVDRKTASTPFSVRASTSNLLGPIVGILGQKYGVRTVTIVGGITCTLSTALCFFAPDVSWITILFGGLGGVGTALTITLPQVVIGQYFERHRTTAAGMAFSGGCVGSFVFPVLLDYLLQNYGVPGTLLVLGAVIMHTIPAAMILRRPPWLKIKPEAKNDVENASLPTVVVSSPEESCELKEGNEMSEDKDESISVKTSKNIPNVEFLRQNSELVGKMLVKTPVHNVMSVNVNQNSASLDLLCILEEMEDIFRSLQVSRDASQFHQNLMLAQNKHSGVFQQDGCKTQVSHLNLPSYGVLRKSKSVPDLSKASLDTPRASILMKLKDLHSLKTPQIVGLFPEENKHSVLKVSRELRKLYIISSKVSSKISSLLGTNQGSLEDETKVQKTNGTPEGSFLDHVKTAIKLHMKPLFLLICLCRAVHYIAFLPVMTTIVDYTKDKGFNPEDGNYAIAVLSLGDLVGRLCLGWVTDRGYLGIGKYMMVVMVLQGVSTASLTMMHTRAALFTGLAVFGMLQGSLFVRHPVLVSKYMESREQSIAMGCINFFSGLIGFGLPAYIGFFRDILHSYDYIFYINGLLGALVGLLWALEPYFLRRWNKQQTTHEQEIV